MRHLILSLILLSAVCCDAQITIDSTRTTFIIRESAQGVNRTLSIYRKFIPGTGVRHIAIYQPVAEPFGEEPETLSLQLDTELKNLKKLLDIALSKRVFNFSKLSLNFTVYREFTDRLIGIYNNSTLWADYRQKNSATLRKTTTLWEGSQITEPSFDGAVAAAILDTSNFTAPVAAFFKAYSYTVSAPKFPEEHQQIVSTDKLMLHGQNPNLYIPIPDYYFTLTKIEN